MNTIVVPSFDTPLVSFQITNNTGTAYDPFGAEGMVSHIAELSMRGTRDWSRNELDANIDSLGASLGFSVGRDTISLSGHCLERHLETLFGIAQQVLHTPRFAPEEHEKLRRETLYDLDELRDDDGSLAQRFFAKFVAPGYVYSRTALGNADTLSGLSVSAAQTLHPQLFCLQDLIFGFSGAVSQERVQALTTAFSDTAAAATSLPAPNLVPPPRQTGRRLIIVDKPERQQCQIVFGHLMPVYGSADTDALRIATTALGGMFTSRLMQEIRVKHGWSYGASCHIQKARGPHNLQVTMAPAQDVCAAALSKGLQMYETLQADGLTAEEFDFTRSYLIGSSAFDTTTARQRLKRKIRADRFGLSPNYEDEFPKRIANMSLASVNSAIHSNMAPNDLCVVVVASAEGIRAELETIGFDSVQVVDFQSY